LLPQECIFARVHSCRSAVSFRRLSDCEPTDLSVSGWIIRIRRGALEPIRITVFWRIANAFAKCRRATPRRKGFHSVLKRRLTHARSTKYASAFNMDRNAAKPCGSHSIALYNVFESFPRRECQKADQSTATRPAAAPVEEPSRFLRFDNTKRNISVGPKKYAIVPCTDEGRLPCGGVGQAFQKSVCALRHSSRPRNCGIARPFYFKTAAARRHSFASASVRTRFPGRTSLGVRHLCSEVGGQPNLFRHTPRRSTSFVDCVTRWLEEIRVSRLVVGG
jgi:hypothetical protein